MMNSSTHRRHLPPTFFRRAQQAIVALAAFMALVSMGMVVTSWIDDSAIARNARTATAEVVDINALRTLVRFREEDGTYHQPGIGLKYPTGLEEGQNVRVEYSATDPSNVKVQGRAWTLSIIPALSTLAIVMVIAAALLGLIQWWKHKSLRSVSCSTVTSGSD